MPELPDLEIFKENIPKRLRSKTLTGVTVFMPQKVNTPQRLLADVLRGAVLETVEREGKELYFCFDDNRSVSAHLMLNGEISVAADENALTRIPFKIFAFHFEREHLVFSDRGGLCSLKFMPPKSAVPDALSPEFTREYFRRLLQTKARMNIKMLLIDQKLIRGIGNAYADEILWEAKISPRSLAGKIPDEAPERLYAAIGSVLHNAVASIRELAPDIISGEVRDFLKVHNKSLKATESGHKIQVERINGKITYFTQEQTEYLF